MDPYVFASGILFLFIYFIDWEGNCTEFCYQFINFSVQAPVAHS